MFYKVNLLHPLKHALEIFTDASKERWDSLKRAHFKGNLVPSRKQTTHKLCGTKGGLSGSKRVSVPLLEQHSSYSYRQHHRRGVKCAFLWRILTWCFRKQITLKGRHIAGWLNVIADKLSRLGKTIQTEWSLLPEVFLAIWPLWYQPQVGLFATRFNN